ncbi:MAG: zinc ribbon domain-containing protein [candidate division KSB1 bacterium]|nr:zinc ribbon domain-containing protein [candidate division KSB1 bacterium]
MPTYEFVCSSCGQRFELFLSIRQREQAEYLRCPSCGSEKTSQLFTEVMFYSRGGTGSRTSSGRSCSGPCPPTCKCG